MTDVEDVLRELVAKLPKCYCCELPATRAFGRGGARYCDEHGEGIPDYPRAEPLRRAVVALAQAPAAHDQADLAAAVDEALRLWGVWQMGPGTPDDRKAFAYAMGRLYTARHAGAPKGEP